MDDHVIAHVLAGHSRVGDGPFNFFMSLYRGPGAAGFTREETDDVRLLLRHLQQALALSLRLTLEGQMAGTGEWALVDKGGELFLRSPGYAQAATGRDVVVRTEPYSDDLYLKIARPAGRVGHLTEREREVCGLYLDGLSRHDVAARLGLSENTVRNQIASIYRKTGCHDKLGLSRIIGGRG
mgnify:FL=1